MKQKNEKIINIYCTNYSHREEMCCQQLNFFFNKKCFKNTFDFYA